MFGDGVVVGGFEMIPAGEGGGEHEDGGFGGMEISNKSIDELKFVAWVDKDIILALGLAGLGIVLQGAGDSSAESYDSGARMSKILFFGHTQGRSAKLTVLKKGFLLIRTRHSNSLDCLQGIVWDVEPLGVHYVVFDFVGAHREKSAETDMKGKVLDNHALGAKLG